MESGFPPRLAAGNRVWTELGYSDHGPIEGPKINIAPRMGGVITGTEKPYYTMDHLSPRIDHPVGPREARLATE